MDVSGKSPSMLTNKRIVTEGKRILYEWTSMRVGEIADALGFEDNSNFVKFFKRYTGMTHRSIECLYGSSSPTNCRSAINYAPSLLI